MSVPDAAGDAVDDLRLYEEIVRLARAALPSVLATVVDTSGSAPRRAGAKMLIRADGSLLGSIGGGAVEKQVVADALAVLRERRPRLEEFRLTEKHGHVCGGTMRIYLEPNAIAPRLIVVGAGHVGAALGVAAAFAGFRLTFIDERPDYACAQRLPAAEAIVCAPPEIALAELAIDATCAIVIATPTYAQDFAAVRAALASPARFIGVIGSRRKRAVLVATLTQEGYGSAEIERVQIPVGIAIGAQTPQEIAISIVAQLIERHQRG